ncbi:2099_t:CDS:2, partial [Funneliformis geosporum]
MAVFSQLMQGDMSIEQFSTRIKKLLRSEYINLNDENRRLKVENSKLVSQNACMEISLAKAEADNFVKSEEVKSLQSVINLLALGYSDKNNQSNPHVKSGLIITLQGEKNDISASSIIGILDSSIEEEKTSDSNSMSLKSNLLEPILPVTSAIE